MIKVSSKEEGLEMARNKAQANYTNYRVVELKDGSFFTGTAKKMELHFPKALGWNCNYIW